MMAAPQRIVIVGGSLAGARAAQSLRDRGYEGALALVGAEEHLPYDRPPLSKSVLAGTSEPGDHPVLSAEEAASLQLELHLGRRAVALDPRARTIHLANGERLPYDAAVIATGGAPRIPAGWADLRGVHSLRTRED